MASGRRDLTTLGYRRIVLLLIYLVVLPSLLMSTVGVILLVSGEQKVNLLLGILVLTLSATLTTGVILVWVFLRRQRNLSELQSDFVSKVSHELRTPLTSIRLFTETLSLRRGDPATEDRCIQALTKESARLQALIDRLLDWGRMESGRRVYRMAEHQVSEVVGEAVAAFEPTRERNRVDLQVCVDEDLPLIQCDRAAIVDCLVNLLSNANKYGGDDRWVEVRAERSPDGVRLSVADHGVGIDKRHQKRIFEKFYRVDDLLSRQQDGSGLGLAIVQHVVRAHGGRVDVESERGKGSRFFLELPRQTRQQQPGDALED